MFAQEAEADEDIRLNVRLFHKCLADKRRFCPDVAPGNAAARSCLLDARNEPGFSAACRCGRPAAAAPAWWRRRPACCMHPFASPRCELC